MILNSAEINERGANFTQSNFPLEVIHIGEPANNMVYFHWHSYMEISYVVDGCGLYEIEEKRYPVKTGDVIIINSNEKHRVTYLPEKMLYETVIHFDTRLIYSLDDILLDLKYLRMFGKGVMVDNCPDLSPDEKIYIASQISDITEEYQKKKPFFELMLKSKLLAVIASLLRICESKPVDEYNDIIKKNNIDRLEKIIKYINQNYYTFLSMEHVANKFYMNSSYFSEYFKKNMGVNFTEYLAHIRINKAIQLLKQNRLNSTEIAYECGFNNTASFYNAFRKVTGTNPGNLKKTNILLR